MFDMDQFASAGCTALVVAGNGDIGREIAGITQCFAAEWGEKGVW